MNRRPGPLPDPSVARSSGLPWAVLLCSLILSSGCTRLTIHQADGTVSSRTAFGVVNLETQPARQPQIVKIDGVGLAIVNGSAVVGYHSANMAILPTDDCRVVVWVDPDTSIESLKDLLAGDSRFCDVGPGASALASE